MKVWLHRKTSHPPDGCLPVCCVGRCGAGSTPYSLAPSPLESKAVPCRVKATEKGIVIISLASHI